MSSLKIFNHKSVNFHDREKVRNQVEAIKLYKISIFEIFGTSTKLLTKRIKVVNRKIYYSINKRSYLAP